MSEYKIDLDSLKLEKDSNRNRLITFLKEKYPTKSADNLLTLYILICCFNTYTSTDSTRLKQIFDTTYKKCILKHETDLSSQLGCDLYEQLCKCLKNGLNEQKVFDQAKRHIKRLLENEYLPSYFKSIKSVRALSSSSSLTTSQNMTQAKTASNMSLNLISRSESNELIQPPPPNPYHVQTEPVYFNNQNADNKSVVSDGKLSVKKNYKSSKSTKENETKQRNDRKKMIEMMTSKLDKFNMDQQLNDHLNHVSRINYKPSVSKSAKLDDNIQKSNTSDVRSQINNNLVDSEKRTLAYYLPGESLAYISTFNGKNLTLGQFKRLIIKKGSFRYFFKTKSDLLGDECVVFEEVTDDKVNVPMFNDKVIAKIEYNN